MIFWIYFVVVRALCKSACKLDETGKSRIVWRFIGPIEVSCWRGWIVIKRSPTEVTVRVSKAKKWPMTFSRLRPCRWNRRPAADLLPARQDLQAIIVALSPWPGTTLSAVSCGGGASRRPPVATCAARVRTSPPAPDTKWENKWMKSERESEKKTKI